MNRLFGTAAIVAAWVSVAMAQWISVSVDRYMGIYSAGDTAGFGIAVDSLFYRDATYQIRPGGLGGESHAITDEQTAVKHTSTEPGWTLVEVKATGADDKVITSYGSAIFSPERIRPALPRPDDFDAFWESKLEELAGVPANPQLTAGESGKEGVRYYTLTMDNIRGSRIHGQLAHPQREGKFPAMLVLQWAGVYPLQKGWVVDRAGEGWLALNIMAHDLPAFESAEFYREQSEGPLKGYPAIGNDDRETSYFLRMYLACYRAAEYLRTRDDWDGQVLIATGGSQGGMQALVVAALHPGITAVLVNVPAGCDNASLDAGRAPGWPMWPHQVGDKDAARVKEAGRYFDVVNFTPRITCPMLVGIGGRDTVCPPPGIYAAVNHMTAPVEVVYMHPGTHSTWHDEYHSRHHAWLRQLREGKPAPVEPSSRSTR